MALTEDNVISARIEAGKQALKMQVRKDNDYTSRFKDPSAFVNWVYQEDDEFSEIPLPAAVGNVPYVQTNIRTKAAAICFTDADWYAETQEPELADIPKEVLKTLWRERNWTRLTKKAALKRFITGKGCVCVYWKDPAPDVQFAGPVVEHVQLKELAVDPHVTDWHDLRWAARKVMMPRDEAQQKWPNAPGIGDYDPSHAGDDARKSTAIELWIYWDATTEAVFMEKGKACLEKSENLYECVPLVFIEGDIDPNTEFDTGDFDATVGLQVMATYLDDLINNMARHGGSIMLYDVNKFSDKDAKSIERGLQQGMIGTDGDPEGAVHYTPTEPMNDSVLRARENIQNAIDAATGVNQYMKGVVANPSKFATEVAATEGQSGARGDQDRKQYENFCTRVAQMAIRWLIKFVKPETPEEFLLLEALQSITFLAVVEQSTSYKNPAALQQANIILLQTLAPIAQAVGLNMRALVEDTLVAFGKRNVNRYFGLPAPQAAPTEQPGMQPGQMQPNPPGAEAQGGVGTSAPPQPLSVPAGAGAGGNGRNGF